MHLFLQMLEHDIQESLGTGDAAAQCRLNLSRSVIFPQFKKCLQNPKMYNIVLQDIFFKFAIS